MLIRRTRDPQRPSGAFQNQAGSARASFPPIAAGGSIILILAVAAGTALGDRILWPEEIWHGLTGGGSVDASFLVDLRLPRMLVAVAAGALLGLSGLLFQAMVRNPLASPELLGVSQGAGLAALMVMLIVPVAPFALIQTAAIGGGLAVLAVVVAVARRAGLAPARLALAGIATAAFCAALSNLVVIGSGLQGAQALVWLSGSTYARGWDELIVLLPWLVLGTLMVWATPRILDVLALGDDVSAALGVAPGRTRVALLVCATALAGAAVSVVGTVAFVGLIAPHAARLLVGTRNGRLLVITPILGGLIMATADIAGRLVAAPREVPVGLMAALLGAPYFLALLWRLRR